MKKLIISIATIGVALILSACAGADGTKRVVRPLDHGPHARTTPNQQRLMHTEQEAKPSESAREAASDPNK